MVFQRAVTGEKKKETFNLLVDELDLHNHDDDDNFEINYSFNSEISNEIEEVIINLMIDLENYET